MLPQVWYYSSVTSVTSVTSLPVTVNDVLTAAAVAALHAYMEEVTHGAGITLPPYVTIGVPVNTRSIHQMIHPKLENRFGMTFVEMPLKVQ